MAAGVRASRGVHVRSPVSLDRNSAAARAAPREGKGPQPESGKASAVARTETKRGAGSSLSCNHQVVEARRDFRLYRGWCRQIARSSRIRASNGVEHGMASTRWAMPIISVMRARCSAAEK